MPKVAGLLWVVAFIVVFLVATYAVSQLTSLAPRVIRGTAYPPDMLLGIGYLAVTVFSLVILSRMLYSGERAAGRVKRRVRFLE